ncbi:uncharacterized protein BDZ99DRAFT_499846 [Mytilinidion resinicola]|uniref:Uncharacterized protein n=1 Tax=Mytilinidion resinicola TaxID=574789 RepID=A0A6A6YIA0_9PEZI|nr:uncharacterized protein BDZ99DRAFT_499846 [Mytilinidion resinicola]KAF2808566.1 hypothetical protein BDZ99DRAFT_499846 [Mytilinidion resinicola]
MSDALVQLAENVILLQKLNPEPEKAGTNPAPKLPSSKRTLSMKHEQAILESLSFLLASSDKPDRILALCMEEKRNPPGVILSYAVNIDGQEVLRVGIDGVAKILKREAYEHDEQNRVALRHQIASHSQSRLLRRLDSTHQLSSQRNLSPKVSVAIRLRRVLESFQDTHRALPCDHQALWPLARSLEEQYGRLEKLAQEEARSEKGLSLLKTILDTLATIYTNHMDGLKQVLNFLPSKEPWDPSTKSTLIPINDAAETKLRQRTSTDLKALHNQIRTQVNETRFRVHAEMKLLLYYEQQQSQNTMPPRVIVSSKSACFLCDLFFKLHGGFYTPKTHGTLYEKWTLPDMDQLESLTPRKRAYLNDVLIQLNATIENKIVESIKAGPLARKHPNESMIFPLPPFTSSAVSITSTVRPKSGALDQGQATGHFDPPVSRATNLTPSYIAATNSIVLNPQPSGHDHPGILRLNKVSSQEAKDSVAMPIRRDSMFSPPPSFLSPITSTQNDFNAPSSNLLETSEPQPGLLKDIPEETEAGRLTNAEPAASKEIIHLDPGIIHHRIFTKHSPPIKFHSQHIHVELSRSCTEHILSLDTDSESSRISENSDLYVAVELFTPDRASETADDPDQYTVDMRSDWRKLSAQNGVMYSPNGLLLCRRGDVVSLRVCLR